MFPWKRVKLGQGRVGRGPDKGRKREEWEVGRGRTDEGGVLSFRN